MLVVIGILIALQINNWNSNRLDRLKEQEYLANFLEEMKKDSVFLNVYWAKDYPEKVAGLELARKYVKYSVEIEDIAAFLAVIGKGGKLSRAAVFEESIKSDEFLSLANHELTFAYSLNNRMIRVNDRLIPLLHQIKNELANF